MVGTRFFTESVDPERGIDEGKVPKLSHHQWRVPIQQAKAIVARLKELKVPAEVVVKKGAAHGWVDLASDMEKLADWFDKYLPRK